MDWNPRPEPQPTPKAESATSEPGAPIPSWIQESGHRVNPERIDLAMAAAVEHQAQLVLAGCFLAAAYPDLTLTSSESCGGQEGSLAAPRYLNCEIGLLARLIQLSLASGVSLPVGMPTTFPQSMTTPAGFTATRQSVHRSALTVLNRLSDAEELPNSTRDSALELIRELEDLGRRAEVSSPSAQTSRSRQSSHTDFLPGELLG